MRIGQTISHYRLTGKLGSGGMGVVYEAEDVRLDRRVALKFLHQEVADDPNAMRRLKREAQTAAILSHPHICTVHDIDEYRGQLFIAMERVEGSPLSALLNDTVFETAAIADIGRQIGEALACAHSKGVVHRDVKPANIFVTLDGQVKVIDFGIARLTIARQADHETAGSTVLGRPIGTPRYMSPERIRQLPPDPRSDLFSLGVVLFEMAAGVSPFGGATPAETISNILEKEPLSLTEVAPVRPQKLGRIVARLLAKPPESRYQSAEAVCRDLRALGARSRVKRR